MKYKDENPDNLGGPGGMLPAEVLKMLNELLEQLHHLEIEKMRKLENEKIEKLEEDRIEKLKNERKIEIVIVQSGGQHVETQIIAYPQPLPKGREKEADASTAERFGKDTPLSTLFRTNFHEKLRTVIESWRPYLINDDTNIDALAMTHFEFDFSNILARPYILTWGGCYANIRWRMITSTHWLITYFSTQI